jgi:four helix bundle protein
MTRAPAERMNHKAEALKSRTAAFAQAVIKLCNKAPNVAAARTITGQLLDSATSVASNYRAACRARSRREFAAKIGVVAEEADESYGWLKLLVDSDLLPAQVVEPILNEADELTAIFAASHRTAKANLESKACKSSLQK